MHLIRVVLRDHTPLPATCPAPIQGLVKQCMYPQLPVATQAHLDKCRKAFGAFFENVGHGVMGGDAARYLMLKSNLPKPQLYHIWRLSDIDGDGRLSFLEFTIAMHLIFIAKLGYTLPVDLDPNTILPPSFYKTLEEVQDTANKGPKVAPSSGEPLEPFSPPTTPRYKSSPAFFGENPFVSDAFINIPARQFREGEYEKFVGDPFETTDPFSSSDDHHIISTTSEDFVESPNSPDVFQNSHNTTTPENEFSKEKQTGGSLRTQQSLSQPINAETSRDSSGQPSPPLHDSGASVSSQTSSKESLQNSYSCASSQESLKDSCSSSRHSHRDSHSSKESLGENQTIPSPLLSSQESLQHQQLAASQDSLGRMSPRLIGSDHSQQSAPLSRLSQDSLSPVSSPRLKESRSERSSTASFQEMVVEERIEPVLQQAHAVDVVESREATPISSGGGVIPESVSEELESLSRASRQFLQESQSKLEEQQLKQQTYTAVPDHASLKQQTYTAVPDHASLKQQTYTAVPDHASQTYTAVPGEYRHASLKGISATIKEVDQERTSSSSEHSSEANDDLDTFDVMSQLDDLEAEMMSALEDSDLEYLDDEDFPDDQDMIEVGALDLNLEGPDFVVLRDDDRKTPVSDAPLTVDEATPTHVDATPTHLDATPTHVDPTHTHINGVSVRETMKQVKEEQMRRKSLMLEATMDELDNFLGDELADINDMFEEFTTKDKQVKEKRQKEVLDLKHIDEELKLKNEDPTAKVPQGDTAESVERISRRREDESLKLAAQWENEMEVLQAERLRDQQRRDILREVESDSIVQTLDAEMKQLIEHEEEGVRIAQREKELLAVREREEQERREKERQERLSRKQDKEEMTIEEWIEWMEEKKKAGMSPEQVAELERRKANWLEQQKQREEKRKREEEEQLAKTRKKMESELKAIRDRDREIKSNRLTNEELEAKRREKALRDQQESEQRKERSRHVKEAMKQQEIDELKPKARSALAARWEERIRARSEGKITREENRSTVITGKGMESLKHEEERITRRISNGRPVSTSSSEGDEKKRQSIA
ncbi:zinc finger CCCH domain-containing protein 13-like isoform X3 [Halichondria panicea]